MDSGITNAGKCVVLLGIYRYLLQHINDINNKRYFRNYPNTNSYYKPGRRRTVWENRCVSIIDVIVDGEREGPAVSLAVLRGRHPASRFDNRERRGGNGAGGGEGLGAAGNHYKWPVMKTCTALVIRIVRAPLSTP